MIVIDRVTEEEREQYYMLKAQLTTIKQNQCELLNREMSIVYQINKFWQSIGHKYNIDTEHIPYSIKENGDLTIWEGNNA